ncbi:hypothetical protein BVC80_8929g21 [Macleaya cordata]|uniref:DUF4378 domain-containing protein n=1 Tax=Macleaya cordata TaxID=56857 RepID=A0A200R0B1_MACCD|nr:hypothetical protein BVC80_8929g21 [Macleaya cordata]
MEAMEIESKLKKPPPMERRIVLLKDFLRDDMSSCSSSGFKSFPRRTCCSYSIRNLLEMDLKSTAPNNTRKLLQSRSKASSSTTTTATTISAFQKASVAVVNVVKCLSFSSVKSPLSSSSKQGNILPRSFSRKLRRSFWKKNEKVEREIKVAVRVKDIMRWKSFRDLMEDKQKSLDCALSPIQTTTTTSNSWSDSDFTLETLNSSNVSTSSEYSGETEEVNSNCKKYLPDKNKKCRSKRRSDDDHDQDQVVEEDSIDKGECQYEKDQFSPISILDFPSEEDEVSSSSSSSFKSSLANMEKTKQKLMQKIRRFESLGQLDPVNLDKRIATFELNDTLESSTDTSSSISTNGTNYIEEEQEQEQDEEFKAEEKARKLLEVLIKQTSTEEEICKSTEDFLLLDFFKVEILERSTKRVVKGGNDDELDNELLSLGKDWMNGNCGQLDWGVEESRKVHITEMEKEGNWRSVSEEEQGEVGLEMEIMILGSLMDELLLDLSS